MNVICFICNQHDNSIDMIKFKFGRIRYMHQTCIHTATQLFQREMKL